MDAKDQQLNDRMQVPASSLSQPVSVWDWPIRLFHWLLAFAVTGLVLTGLKGGDAMQQHALLGYTVLGLLSFRLLWGLVGSRNARFRHFLASPTKAWAYLRLTRDEKARWIGHSPPAGYAVMLMLGLLMLQALTGLIADDEIAFSGPFAASVPGAWSAWATWYHKTVGKPALLLMIGLHLVAIAYYAVVLRIPLLGAMIFGSREIEK
ncbi:MAG: cytochrome B [Betaproteobacteria bacterium]|nr:cytochrome B [Betaproteobacteria bacterium]